MARAQEGLKAPDSACSSLHFPPGAPKDTDSPPPAAGVPEPETRLPGDGRGRPDSGMKSEQGSNPS